MYKTREASKLTGLHGNTLRRYAEQGIIPFVKLPSGQRLYDVDAFLRNARQSTVVCYCRVSSAKQRDDLHRQSARMRELYPQAEIVEEVASGLNFKRKKLLALLDRCMRGDKLTLVVAHRDRLARFAFNLVEHIVKQAGGEVVVLDESTGSPEVELTQDLLSILHHFSCRLHGSRSHQHKQESADLPNGTTAQTLHEVVRGFKTSLQSHCGPLEPTEGDAPEALDGCG